MRTWAAWDGPGFPFFASMITASPPFNAMRSGFPARVAYLPLSRNEFWFSDRVLFAQPVAWLVMRTGILSCFGMCVGLFRALLPSWFWWFGQEFLAGPSVLALGWGPAARVLRFRQFEGELESTTYRPRVRGNPILEAAPGLSLRGRREQPDIQCHRCGNGEL